MFTIILITSFLLYTLIDFTLGVRDRKTKRATALKAGVEYKVNGAPSFMYFDSGFMYTLFMSLFAVGGFTVMLMFISFTNARGDTYTVMENDGTKLSCQKVLTERDYSPLWPGLTKEKYVIPDEANCVVVEKASKCEIADDGTAICRAGADEGF